MNGVRSRLRAAASVGGWGAHHGGRDVAGGDAVSRCDAHDSATDDAVPGKSAVKFTPLRSNSRRSRASGSGSARSPTSRSPTSGASTSRAVPEVIATMHTDTAVTNGPRAVTNGAPGR